MGETHYIFYFQQDPFTKLKKKKKKMADNRITKILLRDLTFQFATSVRSSPILSLIFEPSFGPFLLPIKWVGKND